ncbi:MAG: formimidoylglutamate deiminase [Burkholderiales bacterium]
MKYCAPSALLPDGWAEAVAIDVDDTGTIVAIEPGARTDAAEVLAGPVVPAMPNAHSHAFQRALAGRTGRTAPGNDDSFWTWRQTMYAFLDRIDADAFEAIAAQAYVEMAKAGYASVAEFHYVHHDAAGKPYDDPAELAWRIVAAAETAGLGLTLLPVFYAHGGFGGMPTTAGQRRFVHTVHTFTYLYERLRERVDPRMCVLGVAPHSLRAVTAEELGQVVRLAAPAAPIHIHAAEQTREVDDCYAWSRMRPVEWLVTQAKVDARWCLVHATHMTEREVGALAASGAVAALAPTTEADLGDGTFPGVAYLGASGRFAVGSDSNTQISPFAELRQFEWSQRTRARRRNVLPAAVGTTIGTSLWTGAARGGAQALAQPVGTIAVGQRADLVVLDTRDPALTDQGHDDVLDAAIFGPCRNPVRDVLARGRFVVRDGRHVREEAVFARYRATLARLAQGPDT